MIALSTLMAPAFAAATNGTLMAGASYCTPPFRRVEPETIEYLQIAARVKAQGWRALS